MQEELIVAAGTFISLAATYFITVGGAYLKAKLTELQGSKELRERRLLQAGLDAAARAVETAAQAAVGKLEQLAGAELKQAAKDGKISKDEVYALAEEAYRDIMNTVSPELLAVLKSGMQDAELYIRNEIERQVWKLKQEK